MAVYGGSILVDETRITEWGLEASNGESGTLLLPPSLHKRPIHLTIKPTDFYPTIFFQNNAGVIHVLDGLLQPVIPGFDPFAQAQEQAEGPPAGVTPPLGESRRRGRPARHAVCLNPFPLTGFTHLA